MARKKQGHKKKQTPIAKKQNIFVKIFRFFVPKDWGAEMYKGRIAGGVIRKGSGLPKLVPTWWLGRGLRKLIDPKRKLKFDSKEKKDA